MTRLGVIAIAAAAGTALATAAPADASHQYDGVVGCAAKRVRDVQIVVRSSEARVFRKLRAASGGERVSIAYACMVRSGPITELKGSDFSGRQLDAMLAGRYVAFVQIFERSEDSKNSGVVVVDMKSGQTSVERPADGSRIESLVVKRNGSVAWLSLFQQNPGVWKLDSTTGDEPQRLDTNDDIQQDSLRLSSDRRRVLWTDRDGTARSAPID